MKEFHLPPFTLSYVVGLERFSFSFIVYETRQEDVLGAGQGAP